MATPIGHSPRANLRQATTPAVSQSSTFGGDTGMDEDELKRLKEAAEIVADAVRSVAGTFSRKIPASVSVKSDNGVYIEITAPNAYPFDPDNDPPVYHPLWGNKHRWYAQPYKPFREMAANMSATSAAEAFANVLDDWAKKRGFR